MNIGAVLLLALVLAGKVFFIRRFIKRLRAPANDFSFGRKDLQAISKAISKSDYTDAEMRFRQLNSDDLSQAVDHISRISSEKQLLKYRERHSGDPLAALLLGAWYLHRAWKIRGHKSAAELKSKQFASYVEHLKLSAPLLQIASGAAWLAAEGHSRLIRLNMSLGYYDAAEENFKTAIKADPAHLWAYLHYAECIQPKWGGSTEQVMRFIHHELPDNYLIKTILKLKFIYDSYQNETDFFGLNDPEKEWDKFVKDNLSAIDQEITARPPESIQCFVMYGYMYVLSSHMDKAFEKKYKKLMAGNYTLYPFGIL